MLKQQKIFFDFLRFCIGSAKEIPDSLKEVDWKELYRIAQKQALLGVLFYGIRRLPKELAPEQKLLMQWMVMAEQIRKQNIRLFKDSVKVCQNFGNEGSKKITIYQTMMLKKTIQLQIQIQKQVIML